jgi:hypothetical protein
MYEFVEKSKRGGLSQVSKRLCQTAEGVNFLEKNGIKCPTKTVGDNLHSNILYLDANNLYGECLQEVQPHHSYNWLTKANCDTATEYFKMIRKQFVNGVEQTTWEKFIGDELDNPMINKKGKKDKNNRIIKDSQEEMYYFFELSIYYPEELHEIHNDFPLAPCLYEITEKDVSPKSKQLIEKDKKGKHIKFKSQKLCTTFNKKTGYITTLENALMFAAKGLDIRFL